MINYLKILNCVLVWKWNQIKNEDKLKRWQVVFRYWLKMLTFATYRCQLHASLTWNKYHEHYLSVFCWKRVCFNVCLQHNDCKMKNEYSSTFPTVSTQSVSITSLTFVVFTVCGWRIAAPLFTGNEWPSRFGCFWFPIAIWCVGGKHQLGKQIIYDHGE